MRRHSIFLAAAVLAVLMSSASFGFTREMYAEVPASINLEAVENLFARAMDKDSPDLEGDPKAQYELGVLFFTMFSAVRFEGVSEYDDADVYARVFNINVNLHQAAYWLRRAAYKDYAPAQYMLSQLDFWYLNEHDESFIWLDKASDAGYARAQAQKADWMTHSIKDTETLNQTIELATKAAEQGDAFGMEVLSRIYRNSSYPVYNEAKADEWAKKAREAAKNDPTISFDDEEEIPEGVQIPVIRSITEDQQ
ncbi:MAG: sel1 repeat family protein [Synergistaceae bacterium]|nr:sel1 repeat family protein [Synergistaceae bacterium]